MTSWRREDVKVQRGRLLLLLRPGVVDVGLSHQHVAVRQIQIRERRVLRRLCGFCRLDRGGVGLNESLLALADARGICGGRFRLFDAGFGPLKIGFGLLDGRFRPGELCPLLAVVETGEDRTLRYAITYIRAKFDEHARNLESHLGCDAGLDGAEAENLDRHIALDLRGLHVNWAEKEYPRTCTHGNNDRQQDCQQGKAPATQPLLRSSSAREVSILCPADNGRSDVCRSFRSIKHGPPL